MHTLDITIHIFQRYKMLLENKLENYRIFYAEQPDDVVSLIYMLCIHYMRLAFQRKAKMVTHFASDFGNILLNINHFSKSIKSLKIRKKKFHFLKQLVLIILVLFDLFICRKPR